MIEHEAEIFSRPARTWFQTEKEKKTAKGTSMLALGHKYTHAPYSQRPERLHMSVPSPRRAKRQRTPIRCVWTSLGGCSVADCSIQPKRGKYEGLSRKQTRRKLARELDAELGDAGNAKASIRAAKKASRPVKITEPLPKATANKKRKTSGGGGKKKSAFDVDGGSREGARAGRSDGVGLKKKGGKGKPPGKGSNKGMAKGGKGKK